MRKQYENNIRKGGIAEEIAILKQRREARKAKENKKTQLPNQALGDEDISGDYNVYENVKKVTAGDVTVELRLGEKSSCAVWTKGENTFSLFVDGESNEAELVGIVSGI